MDRLFNSGRSANHYGKILTSFNVRDLNNSDNFSMRCICYGNPDSIYFTVNIHYHYRYDDGKIEAQYWSGKMAYGDILSSETGTLEVEKKICAYAKYSESHMFWIDDEHWGFTDDDFGMYFFALTK